MNQMKRQLSDSVPSEEETKKLQRTFNAEKSISCFESLPIEIFIEICDYLEGCVFYEAFSNLNAHFQDLLASPSLRLKINLRFDSKMDYRSTHIITPNSDRIVSLKAFNFSNYDESLTLFTIDSSFHRLESLNLFGVKIGELIPLLVSLLSLPRLFSLMMHCTDRLSEVNDVYQLIFRLPMLKYMKLSLWSEMFIPIPITTNNQFTAIQYLSINHYCSLDELSILLSCTLHLCRLTCSTLYESRKTIAIEALTTISSLKHISIELCFAKFNELEMFITKTSPQLQVLRITSYNDPTYLDADRWERLISQHLLHLDKFQFSYEETIDEDWDITPYHALINRFNSSFWIKRKWLFRLCIDTDDWIDGTISYSIFPYREKLAQISANEVSFDSVAGENSTQNIIILNEHETGPFSMLLSEINQITIKDLPYIDSDELFFSSISPILLTIPITRLNITYGDIFIGILIDLMQYLPNLDSLVVLSLSMIEPRCLSIDEVRALRLISNNSKITKVNLQQMSDLAEVQFLIDLSPHLQYLEVDCATDVHPDWFVRYILMKNTKYIPHLCSLCLHILTTDENMIEKLTQMINREQLHDNYTMKQTDDKIYLRWNLK